MTNGHGRADWGAIEVRGARENNLRDISIDIPKRRLTVFTGVSGSGKSSLVFETIAAESRRLINETYSAFVQGFMPTPVRPDVESLEGLTAAIIVDQERMGANARSTVGTATDAYDMLRIIFSRLGKPYVGPSSAFSFNIPAGTISGEITLERGGSQPEQREITITGGVRNRQRREAGAVQRQLGGRLPRVQGPRHDLHRSRLHGRRRQRVRGVRGTPIHR
jgi:excinuclease UvrABC ATPase subunit